jgi:hypothetical protein
MCLCQIMPCHAVFTMPEHLQVWDLRMDQPARTIFGPYITGRGLAVDGSGALVTASWTPGNCVQRWDLASGNLLEEFGPADPALRPYCVAAQPTGAIILGGSGSSYGLQVR